MRQVGMGEDFVHHHVAQVSCSGKARRSAELGTGPPIIVVAVIPGNVERLQRTAAAVRAARPRAGVVVREIVNCPSVRIHQRQAFSGIVQLAIEHADCINAGSVACCKRLDISHNDAEFAGRKRRGAGVRQFEPNAVGEFHAR